MKVTKKINHDSMWVKAYDSEGSVKFIVNRAGIKRVASAPSAINKKFADAADSVYAEWKSAGENFSKLIERVETKWRGMI